MSTSWVCGRCAFSWATHFKRAVRERVFTVWMYTCCTIQRLESDVSLENARFHALQTLRGRGWGPKWTLIFRSSVDYDRIRCSTAEYMPTASSATRINTRNVYGMTWCSRNCNLRRNKFPLSVWHTYCVPDKGRKSGLSQPVSGSGGDGTASISIPRTRNELNGFWTTLSLSLHLQTNNMVPRGETRVRCAADVPFCTPSD